MPIPKKSWNKSQLKAERGAALSFNTHARRVKAMLIQVSAWQPLLIATDTGGMKTANQSGCQLNIDNGGCHTQR